MGNMLFCTVPAELPKPGNQRRIKPGFDSKWAVSAKKPAHALGDDTRCGKGHNMAGDQHAGVPQRSPFSVDSFFNYGYGMARLLQLVGCTQSYGTTADYNNIFLVTHRWGYLLFFGFHADGLFVGTLDYLKSMRVRIIIINKDRIEAHDACPPFYARDNSIKFANARSIFNAALEEAADDAFMYKCIAYL